MYLIGPRRKLATKEGVIVVTRDEIQAAHGHVHVKVLVGATRHLRLGAGRSKTTFREVWTGVSITNTIDYIQEINLALLHYWCCTHSKCMRCTNNTEKEESAGGANASQSSSSIPVERLTLW